MIKSRLKHARISIIVGFAVSVLCCFSADASGGKIEYRELGPEPGEHEEEAVQRAATAELPLPIYVCELSNINDYSLFANGGWDGNWYVGFNVCWMEEFKEIPQGEYSRAFIGAKLGRMKTRPVPGKPIWEKEPIPGRIYLSLSDKPSWKPSQAVFLCDTQEIPLEGDWENALEGVGESRWFWAEVPVKKINFRGSTFIALWSPTEYFISTASSPILAGGWGGARVNSWMNNDVQGYAPLNLNTSLKTGISTFEPAIAIKLVPENCYQEIAVRIVDVREGREKTSNKTFVVSVTGSGIEQVWLEVTDENGAWAKHGRSVYAAPYMLTLKAGALPAGKQSVRCAASDIWGNAGYSTPVEIEVAR
ncbi:MAG: hypothetical protein JW803_09775 [Endomicrobiales bacterium]|nr:hypothetical protein [Endomicrobiales bacterium]